MELSKILEDIEEAEKNWKKLLNSKPESIEVKRPEILNIGPRPKFINYKKVLEEEPKYPIFPLLNVTKSRGCLINREDIDKRRRENKK